MREGAHPRTHAAQGTGDAASAFEAHEVVGALNIFCGALVMTIDTAMPIAAEQLAEGVCHSNVMGICCFGEQGMAPGARGMQPTHGNLMFGCLLFSNKAKDEHSATPAPDAAAGAGGRETVVDDGGSASGIVEAVCGPPRVHCIPRPHESGQKKSHI